MTNEPLPNNAVRNDAAQVDSEQGNASGLSRATLGLLRMLGVMFLLGMALNLVGLPSETTGGRKGASITLLTLHAVLGVGVVVSAVLLFNRARSKGGPAAASWARNGLIFVSVAAFFGVSTAGIKDNDLLSGLFSYGMAACFLAALVMYGRLFLVLRDSGRA